MFLLSGFSGGDAQARGHFCGAAAQDGEVEGYLGEEAVGCGGCGGVGGRGRGRGGRGGIAGFPAPLLGSGEGGEFLLRGERTVEGGFELEVHELVFDFGLLEFEIRGAGGAEERQGAREVGVGQREVLGEVRAAKPDETGAVLETHYC